MTVDKIASYATATSWPATGPALENRKFPGLRTSCRLFLPAKQQESRGVVLFLPGRPTSPSTSFPCQTLWLRMVGQQTVGNFGLSLALSASTFGPSLLGHSITLKNRDTQRGKDLLLEKKGIWKNLYTFLVLFGTLYHRWSLKTPSQRTKNPLSRYMETCLLLEHSKESNGLVREQQCRNGRKVGEGATSYCALLVHFYFHRDPYLLERGLHNRLWATIWLETQRLPPPICLRCFLLPFIYLESNCL